MATLNRVFLIGNLTRDVETRVTPKGTAIAQFGLALNRKFKDESGAEREEVTFVDIEAWGKQAELCGKYLAKGAACFIEGRLRFDQWEDKTSGQKRSKLKVVLDGVQFLGGRPEYARSDSQNRENSAGMGQRSGSADTETKTIMNGADEETPF